MRAFIAGALVASVLLLVISVLMLTRDKRMPARHMWRAVTLVGLGMWLLVALLLAWIVQRM